MKTDFIHSDLLENLDTFFPNTCTIQQYSTTYNDYNEPVKSWSDVHTDVKCAIGEDDSRGLIEQKQDDKTIRKTTYRIVLKGSYDLDTTMRIVTDGEYFDILQTADDQRGVKTSIICEKVQV